jgi:hypothetical protein
VNAVEIAREAMARLSEADDAHGTAACYREGRYDEGGCMPAVRAGVELALEEAAKIAVRNQDAAVLTAVEYGYRQCEKGSNLQAALAAARSEMQSC